MSHTTDAFESVSPESVGMSSSRLSQACDFIESEMDAGQFPGAAVAATRNGKMVLHRYWGTCWSIQGPDTAFGPDIYSILYSFTKVISMTVVAMAYDKGLIAFDDPVQQYIPEFRGSGKDDITLRHVLTHSAGLTRLGPAPAYTDEQWDAAVKLCCEAEVEWQPGSRSAYHGTSGLFIAAEVARRVLGGEPWHELCTRLLFTPLEARMFRATLPENLESVAITPPPENTHVHLDEILVPLIGHPAGGFLGTPVEMLQLLNMFLNRGVWNGKRLLKSETVDETLSIQYRDEIAATKARGEAPTHENWGLGWLIRGDSQDGWFGLGSVTSTRTFGHAGIGTVIGVADPETHLALAFLTTAQPAEDADTIRIRNRVTDLIALSIES